MNNENNLFVIRKSILGQSNYLSQCFISDQKMGIRDKQKTVLYVYNRPDF